jgi:MFS transporter, Spinster family, sphingosine-1-phosphate transporter
VRTNRNYLLALLTLIVVFNYVDRLALGLLLQQVKIDLEMNDIQLGLLTGFAFALFYAFMGIPIARWADRGNRVTIITVTTGLWSIAVSLCGAAGSFAQLMLCRIAVAVGEAGCHPPALSLLSDYFDRSERPRAVARYLLGWPLALLVGFFAAGWLNELYGWRATFVILGLPGALLAALVALTVREPRRPPRSRGSNAFDGVPAMPADAPTLRQVLSTLWQGKPFRHLLFCFALSYFFGNGILVWQPTFFARSYGLGTGEVGTWFAAVYGLGGLLGTYVGGELAERYAASDERLQFAAAAFVYVFLALFAAAVYVLADYHAAFGALALCAIAGASVNGPLFAATQTLVPVHMRAVATAILLFFSHLLGMGLGPLAAGALSDWLRPLVGEESLRYALLVLCPGYFWCAWHLWCVSRSVSGGSVPETRRDDDMQQVRRVKEMVAE